MSQVILNPCCRDRDKVIKELKEELRHMEHKIFNLEQKLELKDIEVDQVTANLAEISEYVQDLETALAEAHLMSPPVDGPTGRRGDPA